MDELKFKLHMDELYCFCCLTWSVLKNFCLYFIDFTILAFLLVWFVMIFHFDHLFAQILYFKIYLSNKIFKIFLKKI
jgi:hypothetical protein